MLLAIGLSKGTPALLPHEDVFPAFTAPISAFTKQHREDSLAHTDEQQCLLCLADGTFPGMGLLKQALLGHRHPSEQSLILGQSSPPTCPPAEPPVFCCSLICSLSCLPGGHERRAGLGHGGLRMPCSHSAGRPAPFSRGFPHVGRSNSHFQLLEAKLYKPSVLEAMGKAGQAAEPQLGDMAGLLQGWPTRRRRLMMSKLCSQQLSGPWNSSPLDT